jgi:hypothetical protein
VFSPCCWATNSLLLGPEFPAAGPDFPAVSARAGRRASKGIGAQSGPAGNSGPSEGSAACWAQQGIPGPAGGKHKSS